MASPSGYQDVLAALDNVRPALQADGGDVELLDVVNGVARVRLSGTCAACPARDSTVSMLIQRAVLERAPDVRVVQV